MKTSRKFTSKNGLMENELPRDRKGNPILLFAFGNERKGYEFNTKGEMIESGTLEGVFTQSYLKTKKRQ